MIYCGKKIQKYIKPDFIIGQVRREKNKIKNQPSKERWFEMDWTSPENGSDEKYSHDGSSTHEYLEEQTSTDEEYRMPKQATQLLKYVRPNEKNKTCTRSSTTIQEYFSLIKNDSIEPSSLKRQ